MLKNYERIKSRIFTVLEKGEKDDKASVICDVFLTILILINIVSVFLETFQIPPSVRRNLLTVERISVAIFTIEYLLRLWTASCMFPQKSPVKARLSYIFSGMAIIDLLAILPFYLTFFPLDLRVLRAMRLLRLLRLLKVNRYTSALRKILTVIKNKASELISSIVIIFILMMIVSVLIYAAEGQAQPDAFQNGFSGLWWAVVTFTTVGYGDIVPITVLGKALSVVVVFLGMILVAVPTGIVSSGFMEESEKERRAKNSQKSQKNLYEELEALKESISRIEDLIDSDDEK